MISGIIMASGFSKRMGRNKLLRKYKGRYLVEHVIEKVAFCNFYLKILIAREDEILKSGLLNGFRVVRNECANKGQSEAIKLGVNYSEDAKGYMFFTGDQPFLKIDDIDMLMKEFFINEDKIIVPVYEDKKLSPVIFPQRFKEELLNLQGDIGGRQIINQNPTEVVLVKIKDFKNFIDIDTEEDFLAYCNEEADI